MAEQGTTTREGEVDRGDDRVAAVALTRYGLSDQATCRMINLSENATYLVHDPGTGRSGVLRVHREDYHTRPAIESELDWVTLRSPPRTTQAPSGESNSGRRSVNAQCEVAA